MDFVAILAILSIFVILPWITFHYVSQWKGKARLTGDDEQLLQELYEHARRIDGRLDVIERIAAAENPNLPASNRLAAPDERLDRIGSLERQLKAERRI